MVHSLLRFGLIFAMAMQRTHGQLSERVLPTGHLVGGFAGTSMTSTTGYTSVASTPTSGPSASASNAYEVFDSSWDIGGDIIHSGMLSQPITFAIPEWPARNWNENLALVLCQAITGIDFKDVNSSNSWRIQQLPLCNGTLVADPCYYNSFVLSTPPTPTTVYYDFQLIPKQDATNTQENFFFCFGIITNSMNDFECASSSPFFTIQQKGTQKRSLGKRAVEQTAVFQIPKYNGSVVYFANNGSTAPSSSLTVTGTSTTTGATVTVTRGSSTQAPATSTSSANLSNSKAASKSGLSVGAKVGIALGALALILIVLILTLFCLRKKHSKRSRQAQISHHPAEQVMLTRSMHTDSFGRPHIIIEKEEASISTAALHPGDSPTSLVGSENCPGNRNPSGQQTRHSALSPYEPLPSAPYNGPIGPQQNSHAPPPPPSPLSSTIPRRRPTSRSLVSRGLSTNSSVSVSVGPVSPHTQTSSSEFEAYHDVVPVVYGDARHVPQVFSAHNDGSARNGGSVVGRGVPFLGEETEGMSPEDLARLEEEERRIDAAIAEAEAARR